CLIFKLAPSVCFIFFFQAEDGIRDYKVTGVQTCALPISYSLHRANLKNGPAVLEPRPPAWDDHRGVSGTGPGIPAPRSRGTRMRSEERRVGKECRCRMSLETLE